ncbi:MAG: DHA2 family efflux MFS transporter permease subunit [Proteobacteria bacterium]|nr:DHA2 family efflux MFS transporter permease subunit [Pseudomonadota bacterium]
MGVAEFPRSADWNGAQGIAAVPMQLSQPRGESTLGFRIAIVCVMLGTFMQTLDSTIANVALPYMQGGLQASRDQVTWILTSYIVTTAVMTAPVGWLSIRFGRKNYLAISLAGFTLASMMCGAAQTLQEMVLFRALQGMFGAALSPLSQSIILDKYPLHQRGRIVAIWGIVVMLGPIMGPTLGGFLTDHYSWRWVFYVNVPFGIAATAGILIFLRDEVRITATRFDWLGFVFLALGLGALQFLLDRGASNNWFDSTETIVEATLAGLGLYLFLVHILTSKLPFIPRSVFRDRNYVSALGVMFFLGIILLATSALLPPYLENLSGHSVMDTGLMLAPRGIGTMLAMPLVGRAVAKWDMRVLMGLGAVILLWSSWEMTHWTPDVSASTLAWTTFFQGVAMAFVFVPCNVAAFATLPDENRTDGAAVMNLVRSIGSAVGVSASTTVLMTSAQTMHAQLAEHASGFNRALLTNAPGLVFNPHSAFGLRNLDLFIERGAQAAAYTNVFVFMLYLCLPVLLIILLMPKPVADVETAAKSIHPDC